MEKRRASSLYRKWYVNKQPSSIDRIEIGARPGSKTEKLAVTLTAIETPNWDETLKREIMVCLNKDMLDDLIAALDEARSAAWGHEE